MIAKLCISVEIFNEVLPNGTNWLHFLHSYSSSKAKLADYSLPLVPDYSLMMAVWSLMTASCLVPISLRSSRMLRSTSRNVL